MHILLWKEILLLLKTFTSNDFEALNNTGANATATNTASKNVLNEKCGFLKITHHLSIVDQKLME